MAVAAVIADQLPKAAAAAVIGKVEAEASGAVRANAAANRTPDAHRSHPPRPPWPHRRCKRAPEAERVRSGLLRLIGRERRHSLGD